MAVQSFIDSGVLKFVGLFLKHCKLGKIRYTIKTRAPLTERYEKKTIDKNAPLYNGYVIKNKYQPCYKMFSRSKKTVTSSTNNGNVYWESYLWSLPPLHALAASIEGEGTPIVNELIYFVEKGFPVFTPKYIKHILCYWNLKNNSELKKRDVIRVIAIHIHQLLVNLRLFWADKHNKDLVFDTTDSGGLQIKDITNVKFGEFNLVPTPMVSQLMTGAAKKVSRFISKKMYVQRYPPTLS